MARQSAACFAASLLWLAGLASAVSAEPEEEAQPRQAVIEFTGGGHFDTTRWSPVSGSWEKQRILRRPSWQKTTRCTGASPSTCEECWHGSSCWSSGAGARRLSVPSVGNWTRFVSSIHVRCESPTLTVHYTVLGVRRGELRLRWNGREVRPGELGTVTTGLAFPVRDTEDKYLAQTPPDARTGSVDITVERLGANILDLEFVGYGTGPGGAELATLELQMPETFAKCEDFKACLDPLAAGTPGSIRLRNSNALQLACLAADTPTDLDCARWLGCLSSQRRSQLTALLKAANVGGQTSPLAIEALEEADLPTVSNQTGAAETTTTTTSTTTSYGAPSAAGASRMCINPVLEDVESWSCDCFDEMHRRCRHLGSEYSDETCLRAQMCEHPAVCEEWKVASCDDASLAKVRGALQGAATPERRLKQSLLARARAPASAPAVAVDRALGNKQCV